jgi:hypothetical protein
MRTGCGTTTRARAGESRPLQRCRRRGGGYPPARVSWRTPWPKDPSEASGILDQRYPGAGAGYLLTFAAYTVEGLHYLSEVDAELSPYWRAGHTPPGASVDLSHARWAIADAITAIDLCAGALGRMHCGYPDSKGREMHFGLAKRNAVLRKLPACKQWIDSVANDPEYTQTWGLRGALVHRTVIRPIEMTLGAGARRARIQLDANTLIGVEELVPRSRDLTLRHVSAFVTQTDVL